MSPDPLRKEPGAFSHLPMSLALFVGLAPIMVVHLSYALSVNAGQVPLCFPYLEGCTSISRAARFGLANHLFKAVMLPCAALMAVLWVIAAEWLRARGPRRASWMCGLGLTGALFLVLYASFLGVEGEVYQWLRRYGVTVYFSFTVLAQMLLASLLAPGWLRSALTALCALMLLLGLASVPLQYLMDERKAALNALEWAYALLMSGGFVCVGIAWRRVSLELRRM